MVNKRESCFSKINEICVGNLVVHNDNNGLLTMEYIVIFMVDKSNCLRVVNNGKGSNHG